MDALNKEDMRELSGSPLKIKDKVLIKLLSLVQNRENTESVDSDLIQFQDGRFYHVLIIKGEKGRYVLKFSKSSYHQLVDREIKKLKHFKKRGIAAIPEIYWDGNLGQNQLYCLQGYKNGEQVGKSQLKEVQLEFGTLGSELAELHSIESNGNIWGEPRYECYEWGEYEYFQDFIYAHYISKIDGCSFLPEQSKQLLKRGIKKLLSSLEMQPRKACLVHGDCHPGNIIIGNTGNVHLVDFGGMHYSLPENDFSRMMHYSCMDEYVAETVSKYQKQTGIILEQNLIDLFFLCRGIKLDTKDKLKTEKFWERLNIILDSK